MKKIFSRYSHWLLFVLVGTSLLTGYSTAESFREDKIAMVFGMTGFTAIAYLTLFLEGKKRQEAREK
ncbi:hypothetical protein [Indiicoccus explosivorum]|uniref:hypothetical protein n=1 Tax=Indiicoccus explosivorum TaxID=1917864 RepID=UPI000B431B66|nr:hypothetical protein [Indiicoccus explosivorum]